MIEPTDPQFLDPRSEAQARAAVRAAESARDLAKAEVEQAIAEHEFADAEHRRARKLVLDGTISERELDAAERAFKTTRAALATAQAALHMREFELQQAQAQLLSPADMQSRAEDCACVVVTAPISGQVLTIENHSERVVAAGEPLVEIGDPKDLEIFAEYLSTDAVKMEVGQRVIIDHWGGAEPLAGIVRRIEPFGYTKVSALGIEEQRVKVIIDFTSPPETFEKLGHGYQIETRVVLWEGDNVLAGPLTALFRDGEQWSVFVNDAGRADLRHVDVSRRSKRSAAIENGISAGSEVVLHPNDRIVDGVRITPRT